MFPVECVARGYLTGSGLLDYRATGEVCGIALPAGLEDGSRLPEPIFTPATKAALGDHDENVSYDAVVATVGADAAAELRELTLAVYAAGRGDRPRARDHPGRHQVRVRCPRRRHDRPGRRGAHPGLVAASGRPTEWQPGRTQPSYDKQIVRNWLTSPESGWDRACGRRSAAAARRRGRADPRPVRRGVRAV